MSERELEQTAGPDPVRMPLWFILAFYAMPWAFGVSWLLFLLLPGRAGLWGLIFVPLLAAFVVFSFIFVFPGRFFRAMRRNAQAGEGSFGAVVDAALSLLRPSPRAVRKHPWLLRFVQVSLVAWVVLDVAGLLVHLIGRS